MRARSRYVPHVPFASSTRIFSHKKILFPLLEYTGLLQNQDTPTYRLSEYYNTERGRNYTFDTVDPDFVPHLNTSEDRPMDSAHIGNHSKFANHKPPKGRNVIAGCTFSSTFTTVTRRLTIVSTVVLTNGDIRIGYYAGSSYFLNVYRILTEHDS